MSEDVQTSATIASLRAEVERLKAELQGERDDLAACYKAKATLIEERNDACEGSGCWSAKDLRQALDERRAYAERLLAENVQMSNRQTMDREEIESMGRRNDELREDLANAQTWIGGQDTFSDFRNAGEMRWALVQLRERYDSLSQSIINACTGSGCLNAHELRVALDTARERAGVLEAEVRAARTWVNIHMSHYSHGQRSQADRDAGQWFEDAARETDRTHALDAAKFGA